MQVVAAIEVIDKAPGRLRLGVIEDGSSASLHPFIKANVTPGATHKTDGWSDYPGVPGFTHEPHVVGTMAAHIVLPSVHRVFSNLKTWGLGVYHGLTVCAERISSPTLTSSSSASTGAERPMPPSKPCSASPSPSNLPPSTC